MADTGAPWNIPYVENADLVKDYPTASLALANAIADGLDAAGNAGIGSNVVQTVKTDVFTTSSSSYVDVTGLTVTITPTSASSKVLVFAWIGALANTTSTETSVAQLVRDSTALAIGDTAGSRRRASLGSKQASAPYETNSSAIVYLDSPATTSATVYKVQVAADAGTTVVNRTGDATDNSGRWVTASSITAIEVAV